MRALTHTVRDAGPRAVIAIDEEAGDVTRLHARRSPVPGAAALGAVDDVDLTGVAARAIGAVRPPGSTSTSRRSSTSTAPDNPVIGARSFGADAASSPDTPPPAVAGVQETGVVPAPSTSPVTVTPTRTAHLELPIVTAPAGTLTARELVPFRRDLDAGASA